MAIKLIRQESDTPNVTNYDDARMARYAYGGYDGYVKERGTEIDSEVDGSTFVVKSGVLVLQGWEAEIDANGVRIGVTESDATLRYYVVYLEINRAADTTEVKALSDTAGYPDLPQSDDLTKNIIGTARLPLYRFTAQSGVITGVEKLVQAIEYENVSVNACEQRLRNDLVDKKDINANVGDDDWSIDAPGLYSVNGRYSGNDHWFLIEVRSLNKNAYGPTYRDENGENPYAVYFASTKSIAIQNTAGSYGKNGIFCILKY